MSDTQHCTECRLVLPSDAEYRKPKLLLKYLSDDNLIQSLTHLNVCFLVDNRRLYCLDDSTKPRHLIVLKDADSIDTREMSNFLRYLLHRLLVGDSNVDLWWFVECFLSNNNTLIPQDESICLRKSVVLDAYKQDQKRHPQLRLHGKLYSVGKMTQFLKAHLTNINIFKHDSRAQITHRTPHYRFASLNDLRHYVAVYILHDPSYFPPPKH